MRYQVVTRNKSEQKRNEKKYFCHSIYLVICKVNQMSTHHQTLLPGFLDLVTLFFESLEVYKYNTFVIK